MKAQVSKDVIWVVLLHRIALIERYVTILWVAVLLLAAAPEANASLTGETGSSQSHTNIQPSLVSNYIIALTGIFPSRSDGGTVRSSGEPYLGEVDLFGGNFAPRGWAFCDGQLLAINQNDA
ncbi:MAG: tail fiber protein, partial [Sedimentisphaerales bacterium]